MADEHDSPAPDDGTPDLDASASADAAATASKTGQQEDPTLQSRYAGQTAKVNTLTEQNRILQEQLAAAQRERDEARTGVTTADEAAKALIAAKDEEIARERQERQLERIEIKYPETFAELGEAAVGLSEDKLASMEARLKGAAAGEVETPTPRGMNASRQDSSAASSRDKEETSDDIIARLSKMSLPESWGG